MQEIRCPKCGEVFQVDETGYNQIARQVRDREFLKEIERRERELEAKQEKELEVIRLQEEKEYTAGITKKETEIFAKDKLIAELQAKLDVSETAKKFAISETLEKKNQEIKQMIQLMLTNGMSLEFISKSLSKSEDEIRDLLG